MEDVRLTNFEWITCQPTKSTNLYLLCLSKLVFLFLDYEHNIYKLARFILAEESDKLLTYSK